MKTTLIRDKYNYFTELFPNSLWKKNTLLRNLNSEYILQGIAFESSSFSKNVVHVNLFVQLLLIDTKHFFFNFSHRINHIEDKIIVEKEINNFFSKYDTLKKIYFEIKDSDVFWNLVNICLICVCIENDTQDFFLKKLKKISQEMDVSIYKYMPEAIHKVEEIIKAGKQNKEHALEIINRNRITTLNNLELTNFIN